MKNSNRINVLLEIHRLVTEMLGLEQNPQLMPRTSKPTARPLMIPLGSDRMYHKKVNVPPSGAFDIKMALDLNPNVSLPTVLKALKRGLEDGSIERWKSNRSGKRGPRPYLYRVRRTGPASALAFAA